MDKETLSQYGWVTIVIIIIVILIGLATPFGMFIRNSALSYVETFADLINSDLEDATLPAEEITNFSADDIANDPLIYGIGRTRPDMVVMKFDDDTFTSAKVYKNGNDSDGYMIDWENASTCPTVIHRNTLKTVEFEEGVKNIGSNMFRSRAIDVTLPESLREIDKYAFREYKGTPFELPSHVEKIGYGAFFKGAVPNDIIIPDTCVLIDDYAYGKTSHNGKIQIGKNTKYIGHFAFTNPENSRNTVQLDLGSSLEFIGLAAFEEVNVTNEIILPDTLEIIGDYAFNHCSNATNTTIKLPKNLKQLGGMLVSANVNEGTQSNNGVRPVNYSNYKTFTDYAPIGTHMFYDCAYKTLSSFTIDPNNQYYKVVDGIIYTKDGTKLIAVPPRINQSTIELPEGVTIIYELSFDTCRNTACSDYTNTLILPNSYIIDDKLPLYSGNEAINLSTALYCYSGVSSIQVKSDNPRYTSIDGIVYTKDMKTCLVIPSDISTVNIPNGVEKIANTYEKKFSNAIRPSDTAVKTINIPASVTDITERFMETINEMIDHPSYTVNITVDPANTRYEINSDGHLAEK